MEKQRGSGNGKSVFPSPPGLLAVNLGDDADSTGAVYGQLAGAYYGEEGISEPWLNKASHHGLIISYAEQLLRLSSQGNP